MKIKTNQPMKKVIEYDEQAIKLIAESGTDKEWMEVLLYETAALLRDVNKLVHEFGIEQDGSRLISTHDAKSKGKLKIKFTEKDKERIESSVDDTTSQQ